MTLIIASIGFIEDLYGSVVKPFLLDLEDD